MAQRQHPDTLLEHFDHPAHVGCYHAILTQTTGTRTEVCTLCYFHVLAFSVVRVGRVSQIVCQRCGNALAARGLFTTPVIARLARWALRRLSDDGKLLRLRLAQQEFEDFDGEDAVVH